MRLILTALVYLSGLLCLFLAVGFLTDPATSAAGLGVKADGIAGLSTIRADFTAFFGVTGALAPGSAGLSSGRVIRAAGRAPAWGGARTTLGAGVTTSASRLRRTPTAARSEPPTSASSARASVSVALPTARWRRGEAPSRRSKPGSMGSRQRRGAGCYSYYSLST